MDWPVRLRSDLIRSLTPRSWERSPPPKPWPVADEVDFRSVRVSSATSLTIGSPYSFHKFHYAADVKRKCRFLRSGIKKVAGESNKIVRVASHYMECSLGRYDLRRSGTWWRAGWLYLRNPRLTIWPEGRAD